MANHTRGDDQQQPKLRKRMTRSVGLVLVGTAALMLGMPGGCDDRGSDSGNSTGYNADGDPNGYGRGYCSTQPSRNSPSSTVHHYYSTGGRMRSGGWSSSPSHSG